MTVPPIAGATPPQSSAYFTPLRPKYVIPRLNTNIFSPSIANTHHVSPLVGAPPNPVLRGQDRRLGTPRPLTPNRARQLLLTPPQILRMPGFHRAVGQIHKKVHEAQHGRNPNQPLAPGEATADPGAIDRKQRFAKHFLDELRNQVRGKPTDLPRK
ncbi:hypothetical protein AK830_g5465 [Neonectria ditissima]|uniref:Uncharacterized protein n=1 Tax=Neonectria ditissima TaxID=78410 RepID=A0A0P7BEA0_9HYPO|nr:hypothetical protein AK830_g5465 [Neonectria ditissima]